MSRFLKYVVYAAIGVIAGGFAAQLLSPEQRFSYFYFPVGSLVLAGIVGFVACAIGHFLFDKRQAK